MLKLTGGNYEGEKLDNWPHGQGKYIFENGTIYEGNFYQGQFHGNGKMLFSNGGFMIGKWENGKLQEKKYYYSDELLYREENKFYCTDNDRRFEIETRKGIKPFGETLLHNSENQIQQIPEGTYDVKNGFFDPRRNIIYSYDRKNILKKVDENEINNFMQKYRYNPNLEQAMEIDGSNDETILKILEIKNKNNQ